MALASTTITANWDLGIDRVTVTSLTGIVAGMSGFIDKELFQVSKAWDGTNPVLISVRGISSIQPQTHRAGTLIRFGLGSDFANPAPGVCVYLPEQIAEDRESYSVAGAITLPQGGRNLQVDITAAAAIALTLALPTGDMEGLTITLNSTQKAAHTVTVSGGLGLVGGAADVLTFKADQTQSCVIMAKNLAWTGVSGIVAGAATIAGVGLA
jgi:hypothetical protein